MRASSAITVMSQSSAMRRGKADGVAVDGGDDRLVQLELTGDAAAADHRDHAPRLPQEHRRPGRSDIAFTSPPTLKIVAGAGQHHGADGVIVGQIVPDRSQLADQFLIDGVRAPAGD